MRSNTACLANVTGMIDSRTSEIKANLTAIKAFLTEHTKEIDNSIVRLSNAGFAVYDEIEK